MKKFLVTILALVYLTSTFGATVPLDCCLEKLVSLALGTAAHDPDVGVKNRAIVKTIINRPNLRHEQKRNDAKIRVAKYVPASIPAGFS